MTRAYGIIAVLLAPVLALQALWVVIRAQRLPEPEGPRAGQSGTGPDLRLLILGDSSAAGVGVDNQADALSGNLARVLGQTHHVDWVLRAQTGATTRDGLAWLERLDCPGFDAALVIFGVNDSKNGMLRGTWRKNIRDMLVTLKTQYGVGVVCVAALPPMGDFPLLPRPLRWVLGQRAKVFDADMTRVVAAIPGAHVVRVAFPPDASLMSPDGFHPGAEIYRIWAETLAENLQKLTKT